MDILIIEDEQEIAEHLKRMIEKLVPDAKILGILDSIKSTVQWINANPQPDVILMDIHLKDGQCFKIFDLTEIHSKIIFTTSYDQYALKAFKVNSIDYLLKPIKQHELQQSFNKLQQYHLHNEQSQNEYLNLINYFKNKENTYSERFLVGIGDKLKTIEVSDIAYFYSENNMTHAVMLNGKNTIIDFTLDSLHTMLDPKLFFRVNRKYIVSLPSISDMIKYSRSRIVLTLSPPTLAKVIVSIERNKEFRKWVTSAHKK